MDKTASNASFSKVLALQPLFEMWKLSSPFSLRLCVSDLKIISRTSRRENRGAERNGVRLLELIFSDFSAALREIMNLKKCPAPDSNWHATFAAQDFKSCVSTNSTSRACAGINYISGEFMANPKNNRNKTVGWGWWGILRGGQGGVGLLG